MTSAADYLLFPPDAVRAAQAVIDLLIVTPPARQEIVGRLLTSVVLNIDEGNRDLRRAENKPVLTVVK